ncbi:MAG: hypothetical protein ACI94O_000926, partial [Octadecabacter sp.]
AGFFYYNDVPLTLKLAWLIWFMMQASDCVVEPISTFERGGGDFLE